MINKTIAQLLNEMGDLLELDEANPFRIRAFRRGAETLEAYSEDLAHLTREQLLSIPGVGKGIADLILEFQSTQTLTELQKLKKKFPDGVLQVMNIPGLGAKRARILFKKLKIDSLDKLSRSAQANKLIQLPGFGEKLQDAILKNLKLAQTASQRWILPEALETATHILSYLKSSPAVQRCEIAGSLRRWKETVGDLDFLCISAHNKKAIDHFTRYPDVDRVLASGSTKASVVLKSGLQCDFRVVDKKAFGAAWLYFTGSKEHNVRLRELAQKKNLTLNEYGLFRLRDTKKKAPLASQTEEDIYDRLGLSWIPPELREDRGEVEAALANKIPKLITEEDILGDCHNHTSLSDGKHTLEQMVEAARQKKWQWFFSGDHSPSLTVASGLSVAELRRKMKAVGALNKKYASFQVLCGSEVDILKEGKMDYPDATLAELDCVVASVHSRFKQSEEEMTERITNALKNPHVDILGHISGRLIHRREAYAVNFEEVFRVAQKTQTAIEINGQSQRQELQDFHIKRAIELGVPLVCTTDAHSMQQLDNMRIAVHIARRGWAEPHQVLNTLSFQNIKKWLKN